MKRLLLVSSVLLAATVVRADIVTLPDTVMNTANNLSDPPAGSWFLPTGDSPGYIPPWYRYGFQDWGWNNGVTYLPDPSPDGTGVFSFLSGSLTVYAWGVNDEDPTLIYSDGALMGPLQTQPPGQNTWTMTTFDLSPEFLQSHLGDGSLDSWMDIDSTWTGSGVIADWALLIVNYQWEWLERPTIPAPAGVVLVGLGTAFVGWLRRRRYF